MRVLIAGGGIGGLSLALSLHAAGIDDIEVFEAAPAVAELGVGINVLPHAVRELTELGLGDPLAETGYATGELALYNKHGQRIWAERRGLDAGYRWPQFSIHRGRLLGVLHRAVLERIGAARLHTGCRVVAATESATVHLAGEINGDVSGDVLVAADGVHSAIRSQLYPHEGPRCGTARRCGAPSRTAAVPHRPHDGRGRPLGRSCRGYPISARPSTASSSRTSSSRRRPRRAPMPRRTGTMPSTVTRCRPTSARCASTGSTWPP